MAEPTHDNVPEGLVWLSLWFAGAAAGAAFALAVTDHHGAVLWLLMVATWLLLAVFLGAVGARRRATGG